MEPGQEVQRWEAGDVQFAALARATGSTWRDVILYVPTEDDPNRGAILQWAGDGYRYSLTSEQN